MKARMSKLIRRVVWSKMDTKRLVMAMTKNHYFSFSGKNYIMSGTPAEKRSGIK